MSGDEYIGVTAILKHVRATSVLLEVQGHKAWIPRSLIYGPDDSTLDGVMLDSEITLRMFEWKAKREGLV